MKLLLDFAKEVLANITSVILLIIAIFFIIAIIGFIPFGTDASARFYLHGWQRIGFFLFALAVPVFITAVKYFSNPPKAAAATDAEYEKRFEDNRAKDLNITPLNSIRVDRYVKDVRLAVYIGDIATSQSDVLVSSDDNYFQAKGGVAKAILKQAGLKTNRELNYYRTLKPKLGQGNLAVTSGGDTEARFIIHAAVIDLLQNLYPTPEVIRKVVRRSLFCAAAFGAKSISFPVIGGGTASKHLYPPDIIRIIVTECVAFAKQFKLNSDGDINDIALYVFDANHIPDDLDALFPPPENNKA